MGTLTPAEVLERNVVLTPTQLAYVLGLNYVRGGRKGEPDPTKARALIAAGTLPLVDPKAPLTRWTVSTADVRRYLGEVAA